MGQSEPTRQSDEILPGIQGSIFAFAVTSTTLIVDLFSLPNTAALPQGTVKGSDAPNPLGQYLTFIADGSPIYYACAQTFAALSGTTFSTTATATVNGSTGVVTIPSPNTMMDLLPSGVPMPFRFPPGPSANTRSDSATPSTINGIGAGQPAPHGALSNARFIALQCASGATSTLRLHVSSR